MTTSPVSEQAFSVSRTRFAMVPEWVDEVVTDGTALRVYVRLARKYANASRECHPSQRSLADELGISVATVENALRKLREVGAVVARRSGRGDGKFGRNEYWLPLDQPSSVRAGGDQAKQDNQPSNFRDGPALTDEGSITRPTRTTREKTSVAVAPEQVELDLPLPAAPEETASEEKPPTPNQRAVKHAQWYYDRLGGMGNMPAFIGVISQAVKRDFTDAQIRVALGFLAENRWTLTAEKLANALRGGPRTASAVPPRGPDGRDPRKFYLPDGRELQR
jgi:biotin operon repressor